MESRVTKLEADADHNSKRIDNLEHAVYGNGRPGLIHDVRETKEKARYATEDIKDMKEEKKDRAKELRAQSFALFLLIATQIFMILRDSWT